jgi:hypothetical protein
MSFALLAGLLGLAKNFKGENGMKPNKVKERKVMTSNT